MKRIAILGLGLAMLLVFAACANTPAPTPTPVSTPIVTPEETATPIVGDQGAATQSPDISSGATPEGGWTIPDFKEGTVVEPNDIPDIISAFNTKYQDYELVGVTHGMMEENQLYVVEYKDKAGVTGQAYIRPDATWFEPGAAITTP